METCLICNKEKTFSTLSCKLCGMGIENTHKAMGFVFCCDKCAEHFEQMYEKSSFSERAIMIQKDIVI